MSATRIEFHVSRKQVLTGDVFHLELKPQNPFTFVPGQWLSVVLPGTQPELRRAYSIVSPAGLAHVDLCVQKIPGGVGSQYLDSLQVRDVLEAEAPFGTFSFHPKGGRGACFLSTGTGIAPFRSMLLTPGVVSASQVWCVLGVRRVEDILYEQDLANLPGVQWRVCLSQGAKPNPYFEGRVTRWLETEGANAFPWSETDFYLCGNGAMIREVKAQLKARGVEKSAIRQEIYFKPSN